MNSQILEYLLNQTEISQWAKKFRKLVSSTSNNQNNFDTKPSFSHRILIHNYSRNTVFVGGLHCIL